MSLDFRTMNKFNSLVFLLIAIPTTLVAQRFSKRDDLLILTAGTGVSKYFGDLKYSGFTLNFNAGLQYFINTRIALRTELNWFQLSGNDKNTLNKNRNLSFVASDFEFNVTGMINLFPNRRRFYQRSSINFYGFAGIGLLYMNPKAEYKGKKYALQPLRTEGAKYSHFQPVVPCGLGTKIKVGPYINVAIEAGWRLTFTDYLDDVSTVYPDKSTWTDPVRIALSDRTVEGNPDLLPNAVGARRGDPTKKDSYFLLNIKLEYYLPNNFHFKKSNFQKHKRRNFFKRKL